ncbi:hypothetical protein HNR40_006962 [Nonomuraea endophytica]|uniref:Uncharacterized protein n=1 Tax=Nonomuraea endophytica TaxID=714136 RepID=A0A7W8A8A3_9ACTN|nr:hypothetical protein [Nonomuraea endophytica]
MTYRCAGGVMLMRPYSKPSYTRAQLIAARDL